MKPERESQEEDEEETDFFESALLLYVKILEGKSARLRRSSSRTMRTKVVQILRRLSDVGAPKFRAARERLISDAVWYRVRFRVPRFVPKIAYLVVGAASVGVRVASNVFQLNQLDRVPHAAVKHCPVPDFSKYDSILICRKYPTGNSYGG